jgi:uncharacterized protein YbaP (TraB family)
MTRGSLRPALLAVVVALACSTLQAAPRNFVFKATGAKGVVYLAGSVHLLSAKYYPLDPAFDRAFEASATLVEELDMGEMLTPESQLEMLKRGLLPSGTSITALLSPDTLARVKTVLQGLGVPAPPLLQFKPWMLAITLQSLQWQKAGFDADLGLDKHYYDRARLQNKPVKGLETLEFQISRFDEMTPAEQEQMLVETMDELSGDDTLTAVADAWKAGDVETVERLAVNELKAQDNLYQRLLVQRNLAWLPQIEALISPATPAFVVVGAAHLVGPDGLLQLLKARGYTIEQL